VLLPAAASAVALSASLYALLFVFLLQLIWCCVTSIIHSTAHWLKIAVCICCLHLQEYAESLGLLAAPQLKFMRRVGKKVVEEVVMGASGSAADAAAAEAGSTEQQQQLGKRKRQEQQQQPSPADAGGSSSSDYDLESEGDDPQQQQQQQQQQAAAAAPTDPSSSRQKRKQPDQPSVAAAAAAADAAAVDGDDDFLTIKQRDVFDVVSDEEQLQQQLPPEALAAAAAAAKPKKRKKQRIKLGAVSGQRTVFDDEGQQLDPLALLATEGLGDAAAAAAEGDNAAAADGDGLHVVAHAAGERFEKAAQLMAARDRADKRALALLRKQAKLEKKIKRKAAAQVCGFFPLVPLRQLHGRMYK
jgi:hypothetical protein